MGILSDIKCSEAKVDNSLIISLHSSLYLSNESRSGVRLSIHRRITYLALPTRIAYETLNTFSFHSGASTPITSIPVAIEI